MAFKFEKPKSYPMEIEIGDKTYVYYVDQYTMSMDVYALADKIIKMQTENEQFDAATLAEEFPKLVTELCRKVFGEEVTDALIDFADGNMWRLSDMLIPYLQTDFLAKFREIAQEKYIEKVESLKPAKGRGRTAKTTESVK